MKKMLDQKKAYREGTDYQFIDPLQLGPWTSYSLLNDPKHMCFVLSRYKFCARMLEGKNSVLEVGCGDGFGIPIVAQAVNRVLGVDVDPRLIDGNSSRLAKIYNIDFAILDLSKRRPKGSFDGVYSIDVIEHLDPAKEKAFMRNSVQCLDEDGIYIMGTPNKCAARYATHRSAVQHINLKDAPALKDLLSRYFKNVFIFSMNDEVVHTGYYSMAHYLFGMGVGRKGLR